MPTALKPVKPQKSAPVLLESFVQRALVLAIPKTELREVCLALTLQCKNLYNTGLFAIHNVLTSYEYREASDGAESCWTLKSELHENQRVALERFNVAIARINEARQLKYDLLQAAAHESEDAAQKAFEAELKLLPLFEPEIASAYRSALDLTVLDNVLRTWSGADGAPVYARLPAKAAQLVLIRLKNAYSGYFEALKTFKKGGSAMTGRPRAPDYLAKKSHFVLELPLTQMGELLIGLGERSIPVDFEETIALTAEQLDAWNSYNVQAAVRTACTRRGFPANAQAQHLRIVPSKKGVKLEVVVRVPRTLPAESLLARLEQELGETLQDAGAKRNDVLTEAIAELSNLRCAGVDFGVTNTATLAFNTGARAQVISADRLEAILGAYDTKLDALVSSLTTTELRELQGRKKALQDRKPAQKLPKPDEMRLRKGLKELYADADYRDLRKKRERWLSDYLHKLSYGLVKLCQEQKLDVLVLGKNTGWKDGMNMGRVQNRRFGNVPISRLIELIRYKAESLGIVVLTTEESYTSKTSFVNNEALKVYDKKSRESEKKQDLKESETTGAPEGAPCSTAAQTPVDAVASTLPSPAPQAQGKRLKHERNTFVNFHQTGRWKEVHADVNAAFNMLRKVFKAFVYHEGLTLKYTLLRLSPRLGLAAIRI